ncbi:MAG TPA: methylmalonyl-CoA mutase family protein, partial [Pararhizobium sp.]|nr:methylmalonyl-CoA mutase family protein [Pararhizobium sp.]
FEGSAMTAQALADQLAAKGLSKSGCSVHFGLDPVSAAAATARDFTLDGRIADLAAGLAAFSFPGSTMKADGRIAHNAGASEAQELAFVLSSLTTLLRACESGGMATEAIFATTALGLAVDQQQLLSIAKLRALRLLHARLQEVCGVEAPRPALIHAETSFRMLTRLDPETNILRNTIAAFAAGVGGADSVSILPHTLSLGLPDAFARRIARNTQLILMRECHLDHVADPAAGSGGIETLTDALAEAAWREFQAIESEGGIMASLSAGTFQRRVAAMREQRAAEIRDGQRPIIGTTLYAAAEERPVEVLAKRGKTPKSRGSRRSLDPVPLDAALEGEAA